MAPDKTTKESPKKLKPKYPVWEYKVQRLSIDSFEDEKKLNFIGKNGWELVAYFETALCIFKRLKK